MKLSDLVFTLTLIVWAAMHVGLDWSMDVVWWMLIVGGVVRVFEGLAVGVPSVSLPRRRKAEASA